MKSNGSIYGYFPRDTLMRLILVNEASFFISFHFCIKSEQKTKSLSEYLLFCEKKEAI